MNISCMLVSLNILQGYTGPNW